MFSIQQLSEINSAWYNSADPYSIMQQRSYADAKSVFELSIEDRVLAVFGDSITEQLVANKICSDRTDLTLFGVWLALAIRQQPRGETSIFDVPISYGDSFYIPNPHDNPKKSYEISGRELLNTIGCLAWKECADLSKDIREKVKKRYGSAEVFETNIKKQEDEFGIDADTLIQAQMCYLFAQKLPHVKFLCLDIAREFLDACFTDIPENIIFVKPNWCSWADFQFTAEDVIFACTELNAHFKDDKIRLEKRTGAIAVIIDGEHEFLVKRDGIWNPIRNQRFNNIMLVNCLTGRSAQKRVDAEHMSLVNSFGGFLYALIMMGAEKIKAKEWGQLVNKVLLSANQIPLVSEDEVGCGDSDRTSFEQYVTVSRIAPITLPFLFIKSAKGLKCEFNKTVNLTEEKGDNRLPSKDKLDHAALVSFNLVRMPRGQFIDGRRSVIQIQHIPQEYRADFVKLALANAFGKTGEDLLAVVRTKLKLNELEISEEQTWEFLCEHLIGATSNKLSKLIKRTAMDAAMVGELAEGESRAFKRYGQPKLSDANWAVPAVVTPHAIMPAGMAVYWGEKPVMLVKHTRQVNPNVPAIAKLEAAVVAEYAQYMTEVYEKNGWYNIDATRVLPVDKGAVLGRVPYVVEGKTYEHFIVNSVPNAELVQISWSEGKAFGNKKAIKVKYTVQTRETQLKGRNNIKAMIARYKEECVINELNPEVLANSIFFADCNKWLDLLMQVLDVAALTAIKNQDPKGLELLAQANLAVGTETNEYLDWSPALALLGVYQPIIDWFENQFGKALWYKHSDASGDWVKVLRMMYTQHDAETESDRNLPVKGWNSFSADLLGNVVPEGATEVMCLVDGEAKDINNPKKNILVFFKDKDGLEWFYQRAWSYAGDKNLGAVWQPVKGELSSVRTIVGNTPLMAGAARYIEQRDPEFAQRLVKDGEKNVHKAAVFHAMNRGLSIKAKGGDELPLIDVSTAEAKALLCTQELKDLVTDPELAGDVLKHLAKQFKGVVFRIPCSSKGAFSVYLPAVYMQDRNSGFTSSEGMSDLITNLICQIILGIKVESQPIQQLASRIKGALSKLCESSGMAKAAVQCRMAVQAKTMSLPGIPTGEVWVKESARPNSVYQTMKRTY